MAKGRDRKLAMIVKKRVTEFAEGGRLKSDVPDPESLVLELREDLARSYQEYRRRPTDTFTHQLRDALDALYQESPAMFEAWERDSDSEGESSEEVDSSVTLVEDPQHNLLNASMRAAWQAQAAAKPSPPTTTTTAPAPVPQENAKAKRKRKRQQEADRSTRKKKRTEVAGGQGPERPESESGRAFEDVGVPSERYTDIGGIECKLEDVRELIEWPLLHPELYRHLGVRPPCGVLLYGPTGCGKTLLAHAIAGELGVPFLKLSGPEVVSGFSGESEAKIRALFASAQEQAPSIVFIDELDAIAGKRESAQREMEKRIVSQLLSCMDEILKNSGDENKATVIVIGATNRPQTLDPALRRAGRFDREIPLGVPDTAARERILKVLLKPLTIAGNFDYQLLAKRTPGFVGADLASLTKEAAVIAVQRILSGTGNSMSAPVPSQGAICDGGDMEVDGTGAPEEDTAMVDVTPDPGESSGGLVATMTPEDHLLNRGKVSNRLRSMGGAFSKEQLADLFITMDDFISAISRVQPSAKREGFATVPNVTWADIGALEEIRNELELAIVQPIKQPEVFAALGITNPAGVLLYGPPGCGKTLLAKAIANDANANFISVKGPELLNKYVGESERAVRGVFERARSSSPCIVFFDELDALCPRRGSDSSSSHSSERVVNQLLTEMDGLNDRRDVYVIAATNRPDIIDPAMLRPGRLDKLLFVPLPDAAERCSILHTITGKQPRALDVDFAAISADERCQRFSGADLAALAREASLECLKEYLPKAKASGMQLVVQMRHFSSALNKIQPSVSEKDERRYRSLRKKFTRTLSDAPGPGGIPGLSDETTGQDDEGDDMKKEGDMSMA